MPWTLKLLNILIDPNLLFLLFLAGIGGIAYEVFHPGVILPGTLGGISPHPRPLRLLGRPHQPRRRRPHRVRRRAPGRGGVGDEPRPHRHLGGDRALCRRAHALPHAGLRRGRGPAPRDRDRDRLRRRAGLHRHQGRRGPPPAGRGLRRRSGRPPRPARRRARAARPRGQVFLRGELWEAEAEDAEVNTGARSSSTRSRASLLHVSPAPPPIEGATT